MFILEKNYEYLTVNSRISKNLLFSFDGISPGLELALTPYPNPIRHRLGRIDRFHRLTLCWKEVTITR